MIDTNQNNVYGGWQYNPQPNMYQTKQNSTLTQEEYNRLMKQDNAFSLAMTETEKLRGICNHRELGGDRDTLIQDPDGAYECRVCGYKFRPVDGMNREDVEDAVELITDILQTIKLLYIDMPVQAQREYFQIIPLIEKIPQLFDLAVKNFGRHENSNTWSYRSQNMGTMNLFNMLSGALNSNQQYYGQPMMYQQPQQMYQQPMGQPYGYQQPVQQQYPQGQPVGSVPPMSNGFGYPNGAPGQMPPMGGYQPQMQGYQYTPNGAPMNGAPVNAQAAQVNYQMPQQPVQQPGNTAPADTTAQTDGQNVQATATFKS